MVQRRIVAPGGAWSMRAYLGEQLQFPTDIAITTLRPDIVLWSMAERRVLLVKMIVPCEQSIEEAWMRSGKCCTLT